MTLQLRKINSMLKLRKIKMQKEEQKVQKVLLQKKEKH